MIKKIVYFVRYQDLFFDLTPITQDDTYIPFIFVGSFEIKKI